MDLGLRKMLGKYGLPVATFAGGAFFVSVITPAGDWLWRELIVAKVPQELTTKFCAEPRGIPIFVDSSGNEFEVEVEGAPPITHYAEVRNSGSDPVNGSIYFSFMPTIEMDDVENGEIIVPKGVVLDMIVFYESVLAEHAVEFDPSHRIGNIKLVNFNPGDRVSFMFESDVQLGAQFSAKWLGLTLSEGHDPGCRESFNVGGFLAYRHTNELCSAGANQNISELNCEFSMKFKVPEGAAPGESTLYWRY